LKRQQLALGGAAGYGGPNGLLDRSPCLGFTELWMKKMNLGILVKREKLRKPSKIAHNKLHKSIKFWRLKKVMNKTNQ
jgi:hypothetical protein